MGFLAKVQIESFVGLIFNLHGTKPACAPKQLAPTPLNPPTIWQPQRAIQTISTSFLYFALFGLPFGDFIWHIFVFILFSTFCQFFFHNNLQEFGGTKAVESTKVLHKYKIVMFYEPRLSESFSRSA